MIRATVGSRARFHRQHGAFPSPLTDDVVDLVSAVSVRRRPRVELAVWLFRQGVRDCQLIFSTELNQPVSCIIPFS